MKRRKRSIKTVEMASLLDTYKGKGVSTVLNAVFDYIQNPIVVLDLTYNLIAHTENRVTTDKIWNDLLHYRRFTPDMVNFFYRERFLEAFHHQPLVSLLTSDAIEYSSALGKLLDANGTQIGSMAVVYCHKPIEPDDLDLLETACGYVAAELAATLPPKNKIEHENELFLSDLIEGKFKSRRYNEKKMANLYEKLEQNLYVMVVDIVKYDPSLTHLMYIKSIMEEMAPNFKYYIYVNNIVVLLGTDDDFMNVNRVMPAFLELFKKNNIYAGLSGGFQNLIDLQEYYRQALNALNYGLNLQSTRNVYLYDNFRIDHFLSVVKDKMDIKILGNPVVYAIRDYDKAHDTKFYTVLRNFFLMAGSAARVAAHMGSSTSEIDTILDKANELFGLDWDDGNVRLSVYCTIRIIEFNN